MQILSKQDFAQYSQFNQIEYLSLSIKLINNPFLICKYIIKNKSDKISQWADNLVKQRLFSWFKICSVILYSQR